MTEASQFPSNYHKPDFLRLHIAVQLLGSVAKIRAGNNVVSTENRGTSDIINNCRVFELLKLPKLCTYTSVPPTLSKLS